MIFYYNTSYILTYLLLVSITEVLLVVRGTSSIRMTGHVGRQYARQVLVEIRSQRQVGQADREYAWYQ